MFPIAVWMLSISVAIALLVTAFVVSEVSNVEVILTGPAGPVNLASSLDTTDNTNAIKNAPVATAIENIQTAIGTITSTQTANLNLLGS